MRDLNICSYFLEPVLEQLGFPGEGVTDNC